MACNQLWYTPWNDCTDYPFGVNQTDIQGFDWNNPMQSGAGVVGENLSDFFTNIFGTETTVDIGNKKENTNLILIGGILLLVFFK